MVRLHPLPLYIAGVPATATRNTFSLPLTGDYRISEILMDFPPATNLNLLYRFFLVATAPATAATVPGSGELTATEVTTGYFAGDGISRSIPFQHVIPELTPILVFLVTNNNAYALSASCTAILERKEF